MLLYVVRCVRRSFPVTTLCGVLLLKLTSTSNAALITLAWDPSPDAGVVGYHLFVGVASRTYTNSIDAGSVTNYTLSNLVAGTIYYMAAKSCYRDGLESDFSTEVFAITGTDHEPPVISTITNVAVAVGATTKPIPFTVSDAETSATNLIVSGMSDNQLLVKDSAIVFSGSGSNRTVTISASSGQPGIADVTLSVSDGTAMASTSFQVNVRSKPLPPGKVHPTRP